MLLGTCGRGVVAAAVVSGRGRAVTSDTREPSQVFQYSDEIIGQRLAQIEGVSQVNVTARIKSAYCERGGILPHWISPIDFAPRLIMTSITVALDSQLHQALTARRRLERLDRRLVLGDRVCGN